MSPDYLKCIAAVIALGASAEFAAAQTVPLPRARPNTPIDVEAGSLAKIRAPSASTCRSRLTAERAIAPPIDNIDGPEGCGSVDLVRLEAVILPDKGGRVEISPPAIIRCEMAEVIADWVRDDLAVLVERSFGSRLRLIRNYAAYHCRPRNNIIGGLISEHGKGNAFDTGSIVLVNGKTIDPTDPTVSVDFRTGWKSGVCARFYTVLGPGSDGYHDNHIHVDLKERRHGYRMCQWEVRTPDKTPIATHTVPLPRPRPHVPTSARNHK